MCRAALRQLLDSDRFGEWRSGLNRAVQDAFGNLPPGLPDDELLRLFRSRAAAFAASLPEMAAAADTSALADALRGAMLAARLNAFLPASVWRDSPPDVGDGGDAAAFHDPAGAARLYDGQPRLKDGRFTYGKRAEVASSVGMAARISVQDAEKALETPSVHSDPCGRKVVFTGDLVRKYRDGVGRKGVDPARLRSLGRAVLAVRHPDAEVIELPRHNPPQRQYLYKFGGKGAIVVYVEVPDGKVRGFIYNSTRNADKFLAKKRGR